MNRTKLLTVAVIGLLIVNLGTLGFLLVNKPQHPMHPPAGGPRGEGPKKIIIERLHFDAEQQKQYEILIEDHKSKVNDFHEKTRKMHDELYALLGAEPVNKAAADSLMQQIAADQKAIDLVNFDHFEKIKALCKPEQIGYFNELVDELGKLFAPKGGPPH